MAWVEIARKPAKSKLGVALGISRQRLRNDEYLYLVRIRISEAVLAVAGFDVECSVELLRGISEHAGRLRVQGATPTGTSFQVTKTGGAGGAFGNIAFSASLLGIGKPPVWPLAEVGYRVERGAIEIALPRELCRARLTEPDDGPISAGAAAICEEVEALEGADSRLRARVPALRTVPVPSA